MRTATLIGMRPIAWARRRTCLGAPARRAAATRRPAAQRAEQRPASQTFAVGFVALSTFGGRGTHTRGAARTSFHVDAAPSGADALSRMQPSGGRPSRSAWLSSLHRRELGQRVAGVRSLRELAESLRAGALALSTHLELAPAHSAAVNALSIDRIDGRYLLSAASDASIALYDVEDRPAPLPRATPAPLAPLARVGREQPGAHALAIASIEWYPMDTGLFATGGGDGLVKLWDTNLLRPACDFRLAGRVHCIAMSHAATTHSLIAAAADGGACEVVLCDPATGAAAHRLTGHRAPPWAVAWSPTHEHLLASAGADRSVRLWDVRRSRSCLVSCDVERTAATREAGARQSRAPDASDASIAPRAAATPAPSSAPPSLAAEARRLGDSVAHHGAVTSLAFSADGTLLLSAARDHRLRLWRPSTGENLLAHFGRAYNSGGRMKQVAISAPAGSSASSRVYYPSVDGVHVYHLLSGARVGVLTAHCGEVRCCVASPFDARVFSGGEDRMVNAWTPPPCGLSAPAREEALAPQAGRGGVGEREGRDATDDAGEREGGDATEVPRATADADAWSDDEAADPLPAVPLTSAAGATRTRRASGGGRPRKRRR